MHPLCAFAESFGSTLYDTGFNDVVHESGLPHAYSASDRREALAYVAGYARAAGQANRVIAEGHSDASMRERAAKAARVLRGGGRAPVRDARAPAGKTPI